MQNTHFVCDSVDDYYKRKQTQKYNFSVYLKY